MSSDTDSSNIRRSGRRRRQPSKFIDPSEQLPTKMSAATNRASLPVVVSSAHRDVYLPSSSKICNNFKGVIRHVLIPNSIASGGDQITQNKKRYRSLANLGRAVHLESRIVENQNKPKPSVVKNEGRKNVGRGRGDPDAVSYMSRFYRILDDPENYGLRSKCKDPPNRQANIFKVDLERSRLRDRRSIAERRAKKEENVRIAEVEEEAAQNRRSEEHRSRKRKYKRTASYKDKKVAVEKKAKQRARTKECVKRAAKNQEKRRVIWRDLGSNSSDTKQKEQVDEAISSPNSTMYMSMMMGNSNEIPFQMMPYMNMFPHINAHMGWNHPFHSSLNGYQQFYNNETHGVTARSAENKSSNECSSVSAMNNTVSLDQMKGK